MFVFGGLYLNRHSRIYEYTIMMQLHMHKVAR